MTRKRPFTDVRFGYYDGNVHTVALFIGEEHDGKVVLEGHDLDMVTAAFFHLFGHAVEPSIKKFGLRKYLNAGTLTVQDCRGQYRNRHDFHKAGLHWSLSVGDDRPGELRLWVQSMQSKMYMNFMMDAETTTEFGRRLSEAAEWDVAA